MLLGVLIGRKTYTIKKYFFVIIIVVGVAVFSYYKKSNKDARDEDGFMLGMTLIAFSLLFDGFMGSLQDRMRSVKIPTTLNLMLFINLWSSLYMALLLIFTMEGYKFVIFCIDHYEVIIDLLIVIFVGSIAQFFISEMIANFGALPLSLVLTTRKLITVFLSVLIYKHSLNIEQWIAAVFVFMALLLDAIYSHLDKRGEDVISKVEAKEEAESVNDEEQEEKEEILKEVV
jgi:solute carrier family 35 (UDP-galactose transporter), member B1